MTLARSLALLVAAVSVSPAVSGQAIRGQILEPDRKPHAGARVFLVEVPTSPPQQNILAVMSRARVAERVIARAETSDRGRFALDATRLDPGVRYALWVISDAYADHSILPIRRPDAGERDLGAITLRAGVRVEGVVRSAAGAPLAGAVVRVDRPYGPTVRQPGRADGWRATTDAGGRFGLPNAPAGAVLITVAATGRAASVATATLTEGETHRQSFELAVGRDQRGLVRDVKGAPIAGARVQATSMRDGQQQVRMSARSDASGGFTLVGLHDEMYAIQCAATGFIAGTNVAKPSADGWDFALHRAPVVRLRVRGKGGRLLGAYRVAVRRAAPDSDVPSGAVVPAELGPIDGDGVRTLRGLMAGRYVLEVSAADHAKRYSGAFEVPGALPPFELRLDAGGALAGRVVDDAGRPIAGVSVRTVVPLPAGAPAAFAKAFAAVLPSVITHAETRTDAEGRYSLRLLHPGRYNLEYAHAEFAPARRAGVVVERGERTTVAGVELDRGVRVHGVVLLGGEPCPGAEVTLVQAGTQTSHKAVAGEDGKFEFARMPRGRYEAMASRDAKNPLQKIQDYSKSKRAVDLDKAGPEQRIELRVGDR